MTIRGALTADTPLFDEAARQYDAILVVSFGGPEGHDDVMPFLRNVAAGHGIPEDRLATVAEHYHHFGGVSPINAQNRALIEALISARQQPRPSRLAARLRSRALGARLRSSRARRSHRHVHALGRSSSACAAAMLSLQ